jgi:hypothetical protein
MFQQPRLTWMRSWSPNAGHTTTWLGSIGRLNQYPTFEDYEKDMLDPFEIEEFIVHDNTETVGFEIERKIIWRAGNKFFTTMERAQTYIDQLQGPLPSIEEVPLDV